jgi:hypothetical protein
VARESGRKQNDAVDASLPLQSSKTSDNAHSRFINLESISGQRAELQLGPTAIPDNEHDAHCSRYRAIGAGPLERVHATPPCM